MPIDKPKSEVRDITIVVLISEFSKHFGTFEQKIGAVE
jgi:hypothetical protein